MRQWVSVLSLAIAIGFAAVTPAGAQQGTSEVRGRVIDAQNAAVPGATIVAKNENTGMFREVVTGPDGSYFMSALTPGSYEMSATLPGFKKYRRSGIRLEVGKTQTVDVTLEVGGIEEAVTVSGESPLVDVTSKEIGGSVQQQEMNDIPSINRNFTSYLSLLPGITATISTDSFGADSVSVNGQNVRNVNYTFDGAGNNDTFNAGNGGAQARIPVEAVQEFQLLTSQFDAEFGSSAGGVVNAVSRQGTNTLHGTAFFFDQNDAMTTRTYFAEKQNLNKPDTRQVQWGGWVGGPVVRDKLHFFANLERIDQNRGVTINIPARSELNFTDFTHDNVWNWMVRMDHQINANNTWAVRWLRESSPQSNQFPGVTNWTSSRAEQENDVDWTIVGTLNSVIKSTKVNVLKLSYTHEDVFFGNPGYFETGNQVDLAPVLQHQTFEDGISSRANRRMDPSYQLDETFSWYLPGKRGDHDLKFGVNYVYMPLRIFDASNQNGTFRFSSSDLDFDPNNPRTYPDRLQIRVPGVSDFETQGHTVGVYAQDKWRVNRRLTVSAGLRYDVEIIPLEEKDNPSFPDPSKYPVDKNNISPRVGATWVLDDASTSVIRGGWGLYFQKTPYSFFTAITSSGVFSDSFVVLLAGRRHRPRSVPGPPPDEPVPHQRTCRKPGAAGGGLPARDPAEECGHRAVRQSQSPPALFAAGEHRVRASARREYCRERGLHPHRAARPLHAAGSELRAADVDEPDGAVRAHQLELCRPCSRDHQFRPDRLRRAAAELSEAIQSGLQLPRLVHVFAKLRQHGLGWQHRGHHDTGARPAESRAG